jgi:hypothetical protein
LAANGGTATANDGKGDKSTSSQNKGAEDKKTESTGTGSSDASTTSPPAKPPRPGRSGGSSSSRRKHTPLKPEEPTVYVKEPKPVEDTHAVQGEGHIRTSAHSDEKVGRAAYERESGAMGIGEDAHHGMQKRGAGEAGEAAREAARTAGVSVNDPTNMIPARGTSADSRAVHGSSAAHSRMHGADDAETIRQMRETRKDDPEGQKSGQAAIGAAQYWGVRPARDPFYLGDDPPPKKKRRKKGEEPDEPKPKK